MLDEERRFEYVCIDGSEFLLRPEQIFVYFVVVEYIWRPEIIRQYAKRLLETECTRFVFVGFRANLWCRIFQEEEVLREDDGFYREPRIFRILPEMKNLFFEMKCHHVTYHSQEIGYIFYDRSHLPELIRNEFHKEILLYQNFIRTKVLFMNRKN